MIIPASIWASGAIIELITLQFAPIFAPLPIIDPLIWQLPSTTTSGSITVPRLIIADGETWALLAIK